MLNKNLLVVLFLTSLINYSQQRNVVLIIADDLGKDYCDIYPDHGIHHWRMPRLNQWWY
jgi:hypothetical protein